MHFISLRPTYLVRGGVLWVLNYPPAPKVYNEQGRKLLEALVQVQLHIILWKIKRKIFSKNCFKVRSYLKEIKYSNRTVKNIHN